jgi:hypothetical protein
VLQTRSSATFAVAFALTLVAVEDGEGQNFCGLGAAVIGIPLGMATAITLDAALLARDTVTGSFAITLTAAWSQNGTTIGVAGTS